MSRPGDGFRLPLTGALGSSLVVRIASAAAAFGLHALLARLAGADEYGAYAYALTWLAVLTMAVTLGFDIALVKYVAAYCAQGAWPLLKGLVRWSHRVVLLLAGLLSVAVALAVALLHDRLDAPMAATIWLACLVLPVLALLRLSEARLLGRKRVVLAQLPDGVLRPLLTAGLVAGIFWLADRPLRSADAMGLHLIALSAAAAATLALLRNGRRPPSSGIEPHYDRGAWLRASLPLWMEAGMSLLFRSLDVILLGALVGLTEAGVYAVAQRLAELVTFGNSASQAAVRPYIAASHARGDSGGLQRAVTAASVWATVFAVATCCVLIPARGFLLSQFGDEFAGGGAIVPILAAGYLVNACTAVVHAVMNMTDHQQANMRITAVMLAVKLPLMSLAIGQAGMTGAALASSGVMAAGCLWSWYYVRRTLNIDGTVFALATRRPPG